MRSLTDEELIELRVSAERRRANLRDEMQHAACRFREAVYGKEDSIDISRTSRWDTFERCISLASAALLVVTVAAAVAVLFFGWRP